MDPYKIKESIKKDSPCPWGSGHHDLSSTSLNLFQKYWLGSRREYGISTTANLVKRFNISERTVRNYAKAYRECKMLHCTGGRPSVFDKTSADQLRSVAMESLKPNTSGFVNLMHKEAMATAQRKGKQLYEFSEPCRQTLWRHEAALGIGTGVGEETTSARVNATRSIFNAVTFAAMNMLMVPLVQSHLICNIDATQFEVGNAHNGKITVKYCDDEGRPATLKSESKGGSIVSYFIKYFLLIFADGTAGHPVFVVANERMNGEQIDVRKVMGLGLAVDSASYGYIVFCKSRCCNLSFFKWLNQTYLFEEIKAKKEMHELPDDTIVWFQLDGEPIQIKVYSDPEMLHQLSSMGVCIGKPPASTTEITQPCDAKHCFLGPKTALKSVNEADMEPRHWLRDKLESIFKRHEAQFCEMPKHHMRLFSYGLVRVQLALQNSMRPKLIIESFQITGIYPLDPARILRNCKSPIDDFELSDILQKLPKLVKTLNKQGELFDTDLIQAGIRQCSDDTSKDALVIYRRRSCILTNKELVKRERNKMEAAAEKKAAAAEKRKAAAERKRKREENSEGRSVLRILLRASDWKRGSNSGDVDSQHPPMLEDADNESDSKEELAELVALIDSSEEVAI